MEVFEPFNVCTCEALFDVDHRAYRYEPGKAGLYSPFEIYDPFGLRNAIVPVFKQDREGRMCGLGTAFHIDGFRGFLTAHHVIDFYQEVGSRPILFLSTHAVAFGTVTIPPDCFVPALEAYVPMIKADDPLAELRGESTNKPAIDVASLKVAPLGPNVRPPQTLSVRARGWTPKIGEIVLAIGFPQLDLSEVDIATQRELLTEGMFGAYGRIIDILPEGSSETNRTPVFVVESDWPSGMSGGPVFNRNGEVVGMVSRSLLPEPGKPGIGYAAYFGRIPDLGHLAPTLDQDNPGWRLCWGVFTEESYIPSALYASKDEAEAAAKMLGRTAVTKRVSNRIGTNDFMELVT